MKQKISFTKMVLIPVLGILIFSSAYQVHAMSTDVPIQGRLTDAGGVPLNGAYSIKATIYDSATGGNAFCTKTEDVSVKNGLFAMNVAGCTSTHFGGLVDTYLGIQVGSDPEMTPRQQLLGVPFAHGLVNGQLSSSATTYLWVPGSALVKGSPFQPSRIATGMGVTNIWSDDVGGGIVSVVCPITIPSVLYGQPVRVTAITVYYKCPTPAKSYISITSMQKFDANSGTAYWLFEDITSRTGSNYSSYTINTNSHNTLSSDVGILSITLGLNFSNNIDPVSINGIRLTLDTNS